LTTRLWTGTTSIASGDPTDGDKTRVPPLNLGRWEDGSANEAVSMKRKATHSLTCSSLPRNWRSQLNNDDEYPTPQFLFSPIIKTTNKVSDCMAEPHKALAWTAFPILYIIYCTDLLCHT